MTKFSLHLVMMTFICLLLSVSEVTGQASSLVLSLKTASSQEEERVVEKLSRKHAPLKIRIIKRKKGEVLLDKKFNDGEDWFQGLSIVVENISGKNITYISGGFLFPKQNEVDKKAPPLYKSFHYGIPPFASGEAALNVQPLGLKPGDKIAITLSDSDYHEVRANLRRLEYVRSIKAIKFNLEEIYFDDGSSWAAGKYFRLDPNSSDSSTPERQPPNEIPGNTLTSSRGSSRAYKPSFLAS